MHLRTKWVTLRLAILVTAAMVLALAATPGVSSAGNTAGDVAQTTVGVAAAPDALPLSVAAEPTLVGVAATHDDG